MTSSTPNRQHAEQPRRPQCIHGRLLSAGQCPDCRTPAIEKFLAPIFAAQPTRRRRPKSAR